MRRRPEYVLKHLLAKGSRSGKRIWVTDPESRRFKTSSTFRSSGLLTCRLVARLQAARIPGSYPAIAAVGLRLPWQPGRQSKSMAP